MPVLFNYRSMLAQLALKLVETFQLGVHKRNIYTLAITLLILAVPVSGIAAKLDTTPPIITLIGADTIIIHVGESYIEAGAKATDDVDGDLSALISSVISLDNAKLGTYAVVYNVTDAAGNAATSVYRIIQVVEVAAETAYLEEAKRAPTVSHTALTKGNKITFAWAVNLTSSTKQSLAKKIIEQLKAERVETELVIVHVKGRTYYRIRIPSLTSKQEANKIMAVFKDKPGYKHAWTSRYQE